MSKFEKPGIAHLFDKADSGRVYEATGDCNCDKAPKPLALELADTALEREARCFGLRRLPYDSPHRVMHALTRKEHEAKLAKEKEEDRSR